MQYALRTVPDFRPNGSAPRRFTADTQLNWLARYVPVLPLLADADRRSLLEVGSGARGVGSVLDTPFVGVDVSFATRPAPPMRAISYDGTRLPFRDGAFHTVLSMDTLEHVPAAARDGFVRELSRVASARVLIGFPADALAVAIDRYLQALLPRIDGETPDWLHEHEEQGMPHAVEVENVFDRLPGWRWSALATTGTLPCLLLTLADVLPGIRQWVAPLLDAHGDAVAQWIEAGSFGPSFRKVYLLEREHVTAPLVDLRLPETLSAGLACPRCDGDLAPLAPSAPASTARDARPTVAARRAGETAARFDDSVVECAGCATRFTRNEHGVLALHGLAATEREGVAFVLTPDWLGDGEWTAVVRGYLDAFTPADPCVLWLRVDPCVLGVHQALEVLQPVLGRFGETPFPELALSDDADEHPPHAHVIDLPRDPAALARWTSSEFRTQRARLIANG